MMTKPPFTAPMGSIWTVLRRSVLAALLLIVEVSSVWAGPALVAAAADLRFALTELAERFQDDTGQTVKLTFGSSGTFTHQIEQGAPFELFLAADEGYVFRLADRGLTADRGTLYAIGRLVVFAPHSSPLEVDGALEGLHAGLSEGKIKRFAIANPEHAPYGRAAQAALQHAGLWDAVAGHLVVGENASQAMQFAASGASQGGIVPLSLSKADEVAKLGRFALIPAELHPDEPLRQRMVLLRTASDTAHAFYAYLQGAPARAVLTRYGFLLPDDPAP
jgi:molybdate transport system substrate-binding protein